MRMTKWVDLPPAPLSNGSNGAEQGEKPYIYLCKTEEEIQRAIDIRIGTLLFLPRPSAPIAELTRASTPSRSLRA